ncbi:MAG: ferrous iron transporter B, partial [Actinomycetia bacterium]|nr:ferrous iron transporter B [Actinomycetes bacterium]
MSILQRKGPRLPEKPCCESAPNQSAGAGAPTIALVGAPNVGKSTMFNALTGARVTMGNWPGTTVEVARGVWRYEHQHSEGCHHHQGTETIHATVIDLPGAYGLSDATSTDQALTRQMLLEVPPAEAPDLTIAVVDAAHLSRSLRLVAELRERPGRLVVALTMLDVAAKHGLQVDAEALASALGCPVVRVDPRRRTGLEDLAHTVSGSLAVEPVAARTVAEVDPDDELAVADERFGWVDAAVAAGVTDTGSAHQRWSDRVDRYATGPFIGPLLFLAVMWLVFQLTTTIAQPLQDGLDDLFAGPVSEAVGWAVGAVGLGDTWVEGLLVDGLVAGVGMLLTFTPLMAIMFVLLALLEDSGYLARAAVVADRVMALLGLPGKAFLPLIVGFGCNVPAISATRILSSPKQRVLTSLLVPFTSCTARLTVYVMLATVFFDRWAGTAVFAMYLTSIVLVVAVGFLLRRTLWRTMGAEPLLIDLPPYQVPTLRLTASVAWTRLLGFLKTASGIIVATVIVVWLLQSIPAGAGEFGEVDRADSVYGVVAQALAPLFAP